MAKPYAGPRETELAPDADQIGELFEFWFHHAIRGLIEIAWMNPQSGGLTNHERFDLGDDTIIKRVVEINSVPGQSVYFRPAVIRPDIEPERHTTDDDFLSSPGVWADLDDRDAVLGAPKIYSQCRPTAYVITGKDPYTRAQPFWRTDEMLHFGTMVRQLNSNIQRRLNGDPAVVNPTTLMRVGGTIAWPWKNGRIVEMTRFKNKFGDNRPSAVPITALGYWFPDAPQTPLERLAAETPQITIVPASDAPAAPEGLPEPGSGDGNANRSPFNPSQISTRMALDNMRAGRQWHNNMIALVAHWVWRGFSDAEILASAASVTLSGYEVRDTLREMDKAVRGARTKYGHPEPAEETIDNNDQRSTAERAWELLWARYAEPVIDANDFVEGLLREGEMSVIYGEPGCGKSFFALDLAFHIATGKRWRDRAVDQGGVIYCALEGGHGIRNRIAALKDHFQMHDVDIPLAILATPINLLDPKADTGKLITQIKEAAETCGFPIKWVVVDTLSRALAGGNENAPDDMGALVINLDLIRKATNAAVGGVHHSGKNKALGMRGHSLLLAATDTEIEVDRPEGAKHSTATVTKQRELEFGDKFVFELKPIELGMNRRHKPVTSCVVVAIAASDVPHADHDLSDEQRVENIINDLFSVTSNLKSEIPITGMQPQICISRDLVRDQCVTRGILTRTPNAKGNLVLDANERKRFGRMLNELIKQRKIETADDLIWKLKQR